MTKARSGIELKEVFPVSELIKKELSTKAVMDIYLVVQQRVEPLPVIFDLSGDVLVLQHHASHPPLAPFWGHNRAVKLHRSVYGLVPCLGSGAGNCGLVEPNRPLCLNNVIMKPNKLRKRLLLHHICFSGSATPSNRTLNESSPHTLSK